MVNRPGRQTAPKRDALLKDAVALRRQGLTLAEVRQRLQEHGQSISESYLSRLLAGWEGELDLADWEYPDRWLTDGIDLPLSTRTLRVIATPGHTLGHVVFHDAEHGVLIGGDHLLAHISSNPLLSKPVGGKSGPVGSEPHALLTYMASLRETQAMDDVEVVLPGHGDPVTDHATLIAERFAMHERRAAKIQAENRGIQMASAITSRRVSIFVTGSFGSMAATSWRMAAASDCGSAVLRMTNVDMNVPKMNCRNGR